MASNHIHGLRVSHLSLVYHVIIRVPVNHFRAKEHAEYLHVQNPDVQSMLKQQGQNVAAHLSKEEHEYMQALNNKVVFLITARLRKPFASVVF